MNDLTPEIIAEEASKFLDTDFGKHFITQLSVIYNGLHHDAEGDHLSVEQKAMKIERAAGVKIAIDYVTGRKALLDQGYYEKPKEVKQT